MKKKLLIGTVNMEVGGIEKTLIGLLNEIDYTKYDIDLMLLKTNGELINEVNKNVNIITPYKSKLMGLICNSGNIICKLIKHILFNYFTGKFWANKNKYDVAISYSGYYPFIDKYIAKSNSNKKLIWVHTDLKKVSNEDKFYKFRIRQTKNKYKYFDKIVCVSNSIKTSFIEFFNISEDKVTVQWNVVTSNKSKANFPILDGEIKIITVGRLTYVKRYDKLIEIHKKLLDNNYKVKTYIAGDGPEKEYLEDLVKKYNLNESFIFLGTQRNIIEIIKQADLFVSTSVYEGWPTVLIETLCALVPFVAPNVSGIKDIAEYIAPKNSYILTDSDIDSIYNGIVEMLENNTKNKFKFNIDDYNKSCIKSFYNLIK